MTFDYYEKHFRIKATKSGFSEDEIIRCLQYAKPILQNKIPIIYNTSNLAALVGYKKNYLKRAALFTPFFYRTFKIRKKNSSAFRTLSEPLPSLKEIQIWILNNILYAFKVSKFAKAYVPGKDILDNIRYHRRKDKVLSLDIENFFGSIKREKIEKLFLQFGYSSNVSNLLGKLCCCDDVLPQGAPTSPYLSNLYLLNFDSIISNHCNKLEIRYTRYADDLFFSGSFDEAPLIDLVQLNLTSLGLKLNRDKIKIMTPNQRQIVTGVVVNEKLQLPKKERKLIRQEMYYLEHFGLSDHLKRTKNNRSRYLEHLLGKINYALHVNPNDAELKKYKLFLNVHFPISTLYKIADDDQASDQKL